MFYQKKHVLYSAGGLGNMSSFFPLAFCRHANIVQSSMKFCQVWL